MMTRFGEKGFETLLQQHATNTICKTKPKTNTKIELETVLKSDCCALSVPLCPFLCRVIKIKKLLLC